MSELQCSRCKSSAAGLSRAPIPGPLGEAILARICGDCWRAWLGAQVMLINEERLSPANPADYERLVQEMQRFLGLDEA